MQISGQSRASLRGRRNVSRTLAFSRVGLLAFAVVPLVAACGEGRDSGAEAQALRASVGQCDVSGLLQCRANGGGNACYPKFGCQPGDENKVPGETALGRRYAQEARNGAVGTVGQCYAYVWNALVAVSGQVPDRDAPPPASAYQFGDWAVANPGILQRELGLVRVDDRGVTLATAPKGSVLVWRPGQCGFNPTHGHIEIVTSRGSEACSDHCRPLDACGSQPRIFSPL